MKKKIELIAKREVGSNLYLLDSQDIFDYVGEEKREDIQLYYYLDKWCDYLNYPFMHSYTAYGNPDESLLRGFIDGFNYAKSIREEQTDTHYYLSMRGYEIKIEKPYSREV